MEGGCACRRIRFAAEVDTFDAELCHCRMCQRASGNVSLAMIGVERSTVRWTTTAPEIYRSSAIATRPFCASCGTTLGFGYDEGTSKLYLTVASFDEPWDFRPTSHFGAESIYEAWLDTTKLRRLRSDEHDPLIDRWRSVGEEPR